MTEEFEDNNTGAAVAVAEGMKAERAAMLEEIRGLAEQDERENAAVDVVANVKRAGAVDFYQPRIVVLTSTIKGKEVEFTHLTTALTDKIWLDFNDTLNARRVLENKKLVYRDNLREAVKSAYKALVPTIPDGYQPFFKQTLTQENFHELIPFNDRQTVVEQAFAFDVTESAAGEFFFDGEDSNSFEIDVPISGEILTGTVLLNNTTKKHENDYKTATEPKTGELKRFRNPEVSVKSNFAKLSQLFNLLAAGVENFGGGVPVWIQVGLMNYYFTEFAESDAKN